MRIKSHIIETLLIHTSILFHSFQMIYCRTNFFSSEFIIKMQIYLSLFCLKIEQFQRMFMWAKLFLGMTYVILTILLLNSYGCLIAFHVLNRTIFAWNAVSWWKFRFWKKKKLKNIQSHTTKIGRESTLNNKYCILRIVWQQRTKRKNQ